MWARGPERARPRPAPRLLCAAALAAALWACGPAPELPPRVLFVGIWEAATPNLRAAAERRGLPIRIASVDQLLGEFDDTALARFDLVFVLNMSPEQAPQVAGKLAAAHELAPAQKVVALDARDSQAPIAKAGLLVPDPEVRKYWRYGGARNLEGLLTHAAAHYLGDPVEVVPPQLMPEDGLYHPDHPEVFDDVAAYRAWYQSTPAYRPGAPWVVFLVHQSFIILQDSALIDAVIREFAARGVNVATVFASHEDRSQALIEAAEPAMIVTQRHIAMGRTKEGAPLLPARLDVPYLKPIAMVGATIEEWRQNPRGLAPRDLGLQVVAQELDGAIETVVVGGLVAQTGGFRLQEPEPERVVRFVDRAMSQLRLRSTPNADKRLAIIYYNKYLGRSDVARGSPTGAFMNGPRSLLATLQALQQRGYTVKDMPVDEDALIARMMAEGRNLGVWAQGEIEALVRDHDPILIPLATYQRWFEQRLSPANQRAVIDAFGAPPGQIMVWHKDGEPHLVLPRVALGNVILAPQPDRGPNQDEALVHNHELPPPHQYLAFYWWLQEEYRADAIVHFGTHGTLELLPTKAIGLSREDWPDILLGAMPNFYPWIVDNLAEAVIAKRRSYATLIGHLVPPIVTVGLARDMKQLHDDVDHFETLEAGLLREEYRAAVSRQARALDLHTDIAPGADGRDFDDAEIAALGSYLHRLHNEHTPVTLHVLGQAAPLELLAPYVAAILGNGFLEHIAAAGLVALPKDVDRGRRKEALGERAREVLRRLLVDGQEETAALAGPATPELLADLQRARTLLAGLRSAPDELTNLLRGLEGKYVLPGPGNDPIRNPAVLPTGRNLYAVNPNEIPTPPAWEAARKLVDQLLARALEKDGKYPQKVGVDLNGFETMRNFGVDEGQLLYLPGCQPVWDEQRNVIDVTLIPAAELGRPRVDVFIASSGTYRDNFATRMELLDKCVRLAAADPAPDNRVRAGSAEVEAALRGRGYAVDEARELADARIFGQPPGQYGTKILYLVPRSGVWDDRDEITEVYQENMSFVYTRGKWGERRDGLYEAAMAGTDTILRSWSSNMTSPLNNHHVYEYLGGFSMAVTRVTGREPTTLIADVRDPAGVEMRDFQEVLRMDFRTQLFNERWIRGMMDNGYAGAGHVAEMARNTFGWAVTRPGDVNDAIWNEIAAIYVKDRFELDIRAWFDRENPHALQETAAVLLEAARKGMWKADPAVLAEVAEAYVESVAQHGPSNGLTTGGNDALEAFLRPIYEAPGSKVAPEVQARYQQQVRQERGKPPPPSPQRPPPELKGQKLEEVAQPQAQPPAPNPGARWALAVLAFLFATGFVARVLAARRRR